MISLRLLTRNPRLLTALAFFAVLWVVLFSPWHLSPILHHSVRYNFVLWKSVSDYVPKLGEYVFVEWQGTDPNDVGLFKGMMLVKRVGCVPPQEVRANKKTLFYCDTDFLGAAVTEMSMSKKALEPYPFSSDGEAIPSGKMFLIGDSKQSYDSRYLGLFSASDVRGVVLLGF